MDNTIQLKSFRRTVSYSICDTGLIQNVIAGKSESEFHYTFEHISTNRTSVLADNQILLYTAGGVGGFGALIILTAVIDNKFDLLGGILMVIPGIVLFIVYLFSRQRKIRLFTSDHRPVDFDVNNENRKQVNLFIDQLIASRNEYLSSKYGNPTRNLDYPSQLNNFNWLLNIRAISKASYDEKVKELDALFNTSAANKPIGFTTNN